MTSHPPDPLSHCLLQPHFYDIFDDMKRRIFGLLIMAATLLLSACEAAVSPNEYRDYTPPKVVAMYPSDHPNDVTVFSNASFYIQFDDRMDPAIAAFDSDALILEDVTEYPYKKIPLSFTLVNNDTCLVASYEQNNILKFHIYRLRISDNMKNFSRQTLQQRSNYERYFFFEGMKSNQPQNFSLTSHANNSRAGRTINLSGNCQGIETITVFFEEFNQSTSKTYNLPYGSTEWSIDYPVNIDLLKNESYTLTLIAAPYASHRRIPIRVNLNLDLTPPGIISFFPYTDFLTITNNCKIFGISSDNNVVTNIRYRIGSENWISAQGTTDWEASINTSNLSNTQYILEIMALDNSGNNRTQSIPVIISN